ncbi:MAG TPA: TIGR03667 family PPOX class F420-dependent oxidoreductase [Kineosporiaceae bacterium]
MTQPTPDPLKSANMRHMATAARSDPIVAPWIDERDAFGACVARHLREDVVVWLTTVSPTGAPAPNPVWFLWDGAATVLVFSLPGAARVGHIHHSSKVSLNFASGGADGDIVVISGIAEPAPHGPAADQVTAYLDKYADRMAHIGLTPRAFAEHHSMPIRITLTRVRGRTPLPTDAAASAAGSATGSAQHGPLADRMAPGDRMSLGHRLGASPAPSEPGAAPVLHLIGCAAPPVLGFGEVVAAALADGWQVWPILTPSAARWLAADLPQLHLAAGRAVRSEYDLPGSGDPLPRPQAVLVAPATANTVNKCAAGISDTLALGVVNDAIGRGVPVVLVTATGADSSHPAYRRSVDLLRSGGVTLIEAVPTRVGDDRSVPRPPFPWRDGLAAIARLRSRSPVPAGSPLAPS